MIKKGEATRERLISDHLALVSRLCRRFTYSGEPMEDLVQTGRMGLLKAVEKFDPDREVPFIAFAVPVIVGETKNYLRDHGSAVKIPRKLQSQKRAVSKAVEQLTLQLSRSPTVREIAAATGLAEHEVYDTFEVDTYRRPLSLDAVYTPHVTNATDNLPSLLELIGDENPQPEQVPIRIDITNAFGCLDKREKIIIQLRFYDELPQRKIAQLLGMSQTHVSRLQRAALQNLRVNLVR